MGSRNTSLGLLLVVTAAGCTGGEGDASPPSPSYVLKSKETDAEPKAEPKAEPTTDVESAPEPKAADADAADAARAPWAPARYAPALGLEAPDGIKVDVRPSTGQATLFESDLVFGRVALRRTFTAGFGWRFEHDARVVPFEGNVLALRLQGLSLFVPVPEAPGAFVSVWGPEEILRAGDDGYQLLAHTGRVLTFDTDGQLTAALPDYRVERSEETVTLRGDTSSITIRVDDAGRPVRASGAQAEVRYGWDAEHLTSIRGAVERDYTYAGQRLTRVAQGEAVLLQIAANAEGLLESLRTGTWIQRYAFEAKDEVMSRASVETPRGRWTYSLGGEAWTVTTPRGTETVRFDRRGQLADAPASTVLVGRGRAAERVTDARGRLVERRLGTARETARHDGLGRVVAQTEADGRSVSFAYAGVSTQPQSVTTAAGTAQVRYDAAGRLTAVTTPAGRRWSRTYDADGDLTHHSGPMGTVELVRDEAGRLIGRHDASGRTLTVTLDERGRPTKTEAASGETETVTYGEDTVELRNSEGRLAYTRGEDALFVAISPAHTEDLALLHRFSADAERVTTPWGELVRSRDGQGDVTRVESFAGAFGFAYDDAGRPTRITYPNGLTTTVERDGLGRETARESEVLRLETRRDAETHRIVATVKDGVTTAVTRDANAWITGWSRGDVSRTFTYTADGDRASIQSGDITQRLRYDRRGRLQRAGDERFTHDGAGRLVTRRHKNGSDTFRYDGFGRLVEVVRAGQPTVRYGYDPQGRLASRTVGDAATDFIYEGDRLLAEIGPGVRERVYVYGPGLDEPLAYWDKAEDAWTFLHTDRQGTVLAYSNADGERVAGAAFGPFGELLADPGQDRPLFFQGRPVDRVTGLVAMRARFYDPSLGRFLTPDPSGLKGGLNAYAFVDNQPLDRTDPLGLFFWGDDDEEEEEKKPGLGRRFLNWVGDTATKVKDTAVGAAQGAQYLTGIGVDDEVKEAARAASWKDITSGRAQSRALGAADAYTKFMTFGFVDPNTRRWAYDAEQAKVGEKYGEAGGWAFAVISGRELPRLLGRGLLAAGRGGLNGLGALWRAGNKPIGELLGNLLRGTGNGFGRAWQGLKNAPEAIRNLAALISQNRGAIGEFLKRGTWDSLLNATTRPFQNLAKFIANPLREGFSLRHPFTQTLREAQAAQRARAAAIAANKVRAIEALRGTLPHNQLRNVVDSARLQASAAKDLTDLTRTASLGARNGVAAGDTVGAVGRLQGQRGGVPTSTRAYPVGSRAPPPGLTPEQLAAYVPDHVGTLQDCGLRSIFGHLYHSGRPVSWDQVVNAARQAGIQVDHARGLRADQVARLIQDLTRGNKALTFRPPGSNKAAFFNSLSRELQPGQQAIVAVQNPNGGHFFTARQTPDGLRLFDYQTKAALTVDDVVKNPTWTEAGGIWEPALQGGSVAPRSGVSPAQFGSVPTRAQPRPVAPRPDVRPVPSSVTARSGVEVALPPERLNHVLRGHSVENFDPVRRLAELGNNHEITTLFPPGTITNQQELASLIGQALKSSKGARVSATGNRPLDLTLRGYRLRVVVGNAPGGAGRQIVTVFPTGTRGGARSIPYADLQRMAHEVQTGSKTVAQIRAEVAARFAR